MPDTIDQVQHLEIPIDWAGKRIDQCVTGLVPDVSRSKVQQWIAAGLLTCSGIPVRASSRANGGETLRLVRAQQQLEPGDTWAAEPGANPGVIHEDSEILVVDKPAGLVVHPGAGARAGTLANRLLGNYPELAALPRAGIVHRLDKDTTGLMVVARSARAHLRLAADMEARRVRREYEAVVRGIVSKPGSIDQPLGRHPTVRTRMAVRGEGGRHALTHYRPIAHFLAATHLRLRLETGRTHQIRVHLQHIGHPIIGDPVYGGRYVHALIDRQALHARSLAFKHPGTENSVRFDSELPADIQALLRDLRSKE